MNRQAAVDVLVRQAKLLLDSVSEKGIESTATRMAELGQAVRDYEASDKPDTCQAKYPGEPTFTVVGRDRFSVMTVNFWIGCMEQARDSGETVDNAKIADAREVFNKFSMWQIDNQDKVKLPD